MDLLSSLNVDVLPEQQTCINDQISCALQANPNIRLGFDSCCTCAKPLKKSTNNNSDGTKGVCCKGCKRVWYCSKECRKEDEERSSRSSSTMYTRNSEEIMDNDGEQAGGHSPIICSLLRLCNIDEEVEYEMEMETKSMMAMKSSEYKSKPTGCTTGTTPQEKQASMDRISTEYESYPATLNLLLDAPCFQPILNKYLLMPEQRRGKRMRQSDTVKYHHHHNSDSSTLTIHIIGASNESELWGDFQLKQHHDTSTTSTSTTVDAISAYVEVLSELFSTYKKLHKIILAFIGPNCLSSTKKVSEGDNKSNTIGSSTSTRVVKYVDSNHDYGNNMMGVESREGGGVGGKKQKTEKEKHHQKNHHNNHCQVIIETHCHNYEMKYFNDSSSSSHHHQQQQPSLLTKPDIVIFFNPGFTCPDYRWDEALKVCQSMSSSTKTTKITTTNTTAIPFLITTNTEMEAIADIQYLHQHGFINSLPPVIADIINDGEDGQLLDHHHYCDLDDDDDDNTSNSYHSKNKSNNNNDHTFFFGENMNAGNRVRQSGNMANDLFVKNKYVFGGYFSTSHHRHRNHDWEKKVSLTGGGGGGATSSTGTGVVGEGKTESSSTTTLKKQSKNKNTKKGNSALM